MFHRPCRKPLPLPKFLESRLSSREQTADQKKLSRNHSYHSKGTV
uniref:Uncharacterized protein n=1 Tax=Anguilla anguilla TaxID=7936 RepID=A0A0E9VY02_ANGAN